MTRRARDPPAPLFDARWLRTVSLYQSRLGRFCRAYLLLIFVYSLCRLVYWIWNHDVFSRQSWGLLLEGALVGVRFDLSAVAYLSLPFFLLTLAPWPAAWEKTWTRTMRIGFLAVHVPFLAVNLIDVEFVNFVGRRMTVDVLFLLGEAQGKIGGFLGTFIILFLMGCAVGAVAIVGLWRVFRAPEDAASPRGWRASRGASPALAFVVFAALVTAARGGLQSKPLSFVNANVFSAPVLNNFVLNTPFNVLKSLDQEPLPRAKMFASKDEYLPLLNGANPRPSLLEGRRPGGKQNVVVIILESFGLEYMGAPNGVKGYTPFLDGLAAKSLFFRNAYADGRRSIEGVAAVMAGIPAWMNEPFISSSFTANYFLGIGTELSKRGYHTSFFHGGHNGTMHFDAFMKSAGVENYYGANEFPDSKQDDGVWGIYDGPMFKFYAEKLSGFPEPFFSAFFTISSHQPYLIPPSERSKYAEGPLPILRAISYADDALKEFFALAEKQPWYERTLFVVVADHTFRAYRSETDNEIWRYRIPLLFFHPSYRWPQEIDRDQIVQQIDVLPSILDFLGSAPTERNWLQRSVFETGDRAAVSFLDGTYLMVTRDYFVRWPRGGDFEIYAAGDEFFKTPLAVPERTREALIRRLKANIQYFSDGMWDNRLYFPAR